ncbi:MBL fold metallo-hydrolase [Schinkia azotoformans]|uniref:MBL fold metallo-hydrolase n=1 Tax=Schinkia azotoformans TaxID=1454 RepID=UPI002E23FA10|nr:MBL fold metallo-hydrolase [Schinkia azotoformans]
MNSNIEEIYPHIYKFSLSIPVPLKAINIYLFKGSNGWTIVDCGFHNNESETAWLQVFEALNIKYNEVSQIVVTHYHPDHYGGAGWLQELTGAPVILLDLEKKNIERMWQNTTYASRKKQFYLKYGIPEDIALIIEDEHIRRYEAVSPHPSEILLLTSGDEIQLGDYEFKTMWSPGHTEGLMTFWSEKEAIFLANDLVLPKITPNIALNPDSVPNPLNDFLTSLRKIRDLPAEITLPGHRQIIPNLSKRVDEIIAHHGDRLELVTNILKSKQESSDNVVSAWDISKELFGPLKEPIQHRFAFAETLSHLEYLVHSNEIKKMQTDNKYFYYM